MAPELERGTDIGSLVFTSFLREEDRIVYDDPHKEHWEIAADHGIGKVVDDGGFIDPVGERPYKQIRFNHFTHSCSIRGDRTEQRGQTVKIAKGILGDEIVSE